VPEVLHNEVLEWDVGRRRDKADVVLAAEVAPPFAEVAERLAVRGGRGVGDAERDGLARLGVAQPDAAADLGLRLLAREHVDDRDVESFRGEGRQDAARPLLIEEVGDEHDEALLSRALECLFERACDGRRAAGIELAEVVDQTEDAGLVGTGGEPVAAAAGERRDLDAVVGGEADIGERGQARGAVLELRRRIIVAREVHRRAAVEQQVNEVLLLALELLHDEVVGAAEDVPVDVPEIVAGRILAVVGELDSPAVMGAGPFAVGAAALSAAERDLEQFELREQIFADESVRAHGSGNVAPAGRFGRSADASRGILGPAAPGHA